MKHLPFILLLAANLCSLFAQRTYLLPTAELDFADQERVGSYGELYDISRARIDLYLPVVAQSSLPSSPFLTLLVCPGGAYEYVSVENEGVDVARWANEQGIAVAVLKYRLPYGRTTVPLEDARAAMRILRDSADVWHLDAHHIGVVGFSAGGHLAGSLLTMYESEYERPDFGVLIYPVLSFESDTHKKTRRLLLGEPFTDKQIQTWTLRNQVTRSTPPCLIAACQDDRAVPVSNSVDFYMALTRVGVSAELFLMPTGGHGWGFRRDIPQTALFRATLLHWLLTTP